MSEFNWSGDRPDGSRLAQCDCGAHTVMVNAGGYYECGPCQGYVDGEVQRPERPQVIYAGGGVSSDTIAQGIVQAERARNGGAGW